jgi:hypothetical protein
MLLCPRCHRANPAEAAFCYFDGAALRSAQGGTDAQTRTRLPHEFVFPSGRRCRTYDELVLGCQEEWGQARDLLQQGVFRHFLTTAGRMDLARVAQEAQTHPDADVALDTFLNSLPASVTARPRLDLNPRRLVLGTLRAGETRQLRLTVANQGKGLLHGTLSVVEGGKWLRLAEGTGNGQCLLKTTREQQIALQVDTRNLPAAQTYSAKLTVVTNGGIIEVPVRLDLAAHLFPRPPFQGVGSPRDLAERMRAQPKAAVPALASGEVARWFAANGWTYPVQGPTAKGVAAVQQFFEGMGLSKPPPLHLSEGEVRFTCLPPEVARGQVTLHTTAKKWVYAQVDSDVPWLRVTTSQVSGPQQAVIAFEVDSSLLEPGRSAEGLLHLVANADQRLAVRVCVEVIRPQEPFTRRLLRPFWTGAVAFLLVRLVLAVPADLYALPPDSFARWRLAPEVDVGFVKQFVKQFVLATWWLGAVGGGALLWRRGSRWTDVPFGLVAGAVAGLAGGATVACLLPFLDGMPRQVWHQLAPPAGTFGGVGFRWLSLAGWIVLAVLCWGAMGAAAGIVLGWSGRRGEQVLACLGKGLASIFRLFGWKRAAAYFAPP